MNCPRCQGHTVTEWCYDRVTQAEHVEARRCVNCGWVGGWKGWKYAQAPQPQEVARA